MVGFRSDILICLSHLRFDSMMTPRNFVESVFLEGVAMSEYGSFSMWFVCLI